MGGGVSDRGQRTHPESTTSALICRGKIITGMCPVRAAGYAVPDDDEADDAAATRHGSHFQQSRQAQQGRGGGLTKSTPMVEMYDSV